MSHYTDAHPVALTSLPAIIRESGAGSPPSEFEFQSSTGRWRVYLTPNSPHVSQLVDSQTSSTDGITVVPLGKDLVHALRSTVGLDNITLEEFQTRYADMRSKLVYRELRGEIAPIEAAQLRILNAALDRLSPEPSRLSPSTAETIEKLLSLLGD